jgi:hemerythrin-like metal-binding protein
MSLISWNKNYSVGIEEMDIQHKQLLLIMNNLNDAIQAGKGQEALQEIFIDLTAYARQHFAEEEIIMRDNKYPEREAHMVFHRELENKVKEYRQMFEDGVAVAGSDVLDFLKEWLIQHILKQDTKYGKFIKEQQTQK